MVTISDLPWRRVEAMFDAAVLVPVAAEVVDPVCGRKPTVPVPVLRLLHSQGTLGIEAVR